MAFTFVPMTIAGLTGVAPADAGVASGLHQHHASDRRCSRARRGQHDRRSSTDSRRLGVARGADLTHGFQHRVRRFSTGLTLLGVAIAVRFVAPSRRARATVPSFDRDRHRRSTGGGSMITEHQPPHRRRAAARTRDRRSPAAGTRPRARRGTCSPSAAQAAPRSTRTPTSSSACGHGSRRRSAAPRSHTSSTPPDGR